MSMTNKYLGRLPIKARTFKPAIFGRKVLLEYRPDYWMRTLFPLYEREKGCMAAYFAWFGLSIVLVRKLRKG